MLLLNLSSINLLLFSTALLGVDGYFGHFDIWCRYNSSDPHTTEYLLEVNFNKKMLMKYNSTEGKFEGYTARGIEQANHLNQDPYECARRAAERDDICITGFYFTKDILEKNLAKPNVTVKSLKTPGVGQPAMLVCSAYNFYPKPIRVTWMREGQEQNSDVTSTQELADGDWRYQIHSYLEHTPIPGEKITCMVEHASLTQPMMTDWDPSLSDSEKNKLAVGASGILLGVVFVVAALIYYRKKSLAGRVLVPTS